MALLKVLSIVVFIVFYIPSQAQHPFDYGKSRKIYFFSKEDIKNFGVKNIYTIDKREDLGQQIDFYVIDFSENDKFVSDIWHMYDGLKVPPIDTLIEKSEKGYGSFWVIENGEIKSCGQEGIGALCSWEYEKTDSGAQAMEFCKYRSAATPVLKIQFHENGLARFKICCEYENAEEDEKEGQDEEDLPIENTVEIDFPDTTFYVYDLRWKIIGTKAHESEIVCTPILNISEDQIKKFGSLYINKINFEKFIDKKIGYRPEIILFEIYRKAVFTFIYFPDEKRYFQGPEIMIE